MLDVHEGGVAVQGRGENVFANVLAGKAVAGGLRILCALQEMPHAGD